MISLFRFFDEINTKYSIMETFKKDIEDEDDQVSECYINEINIFENCSPMEYSFNYFKEFCSISQFDQKKDIWLKYSNMMVNPIEKLIPFLCRVYLFRTFENSLFDQRMENTIYDSSEDSRYYIIRSSCWKIFFSSKNDNIQAQVPNEKKSLRKQGLIWWIKNNSQINFFSPNSS